MQKGFIFSADVLFAGILIILASSSILLLSAEDKKNPDMIQLKLKARDKAVISQYLELPNADGYYINGQNINFSEIADGYCVQTLIFDAKSKTFKKYNFCEGIKNNSNGVVNK